MNKNKRLYKSDNRMISGVCAGIAEYFDIDPTVVRVVFVILSLMSGIVGGIIAYIILAMIIPDNPYHNHEDNNSSSSGAYYDGEFEEKD